MQNNGFVTLHRQILEWEWFEDANTFKVFIYLLLKANHKEKNWKGHTVGRGQLITGRNILAKELNLSERKIRTCLNRLKSTNEVTIKATNKFSLITLVKYSDYQDITNKTTSKTTSQTPTSDQQPTTTNNVNNDNKKEKASKRFAKPTLLEVKNYIIEKKYKSVDADSFINFYESKGWLVGRSKMKSWKATISGWESRNNKSGQTNESHKKSSDDIFEKGTESAFRAADT